MLKDCKNKETDRYEKAQREWRVRERDREGEKKRDKGEINAEGAEGQMGEQGERNFEVVAVKNKVRLRSLFICSEF